LLLFLNNRRPTTVGDKVKAWSHRMDRLPAASEFDWYMLCVAVGRHVIEPHKRIRKGTKGPGTIGDGGDGDNASSVRAPRTPARAEVELKKMALGQLELFRTAKTDDPRAVTWQNLIAAEDALLEDGDPSLLLQLAGQVMRIFTKSDLRQTRTGTVHAVITSLVTMGTRLSVRRFNLPDAGFKRSCSLVICEGKRGTGRILCMMRVKHVNATSLELHTARRSGPFFDDAPEITGKLLNCLSVADILNLELRESAPERKSSQRIVGDVFEHIKLSEGKGVEKKLERCQQCAFLFF
jgi:hypothetical protein